MNSLKVFLKDHYAGLLTQEQNGQFFFKYEPNYYSLDTAIPISISMPLGEQIYNDEVVRAFFTGLLPEGSALRQLSTYLNLSKGHLFSLLAALGGECAGAISLYPELTDNQNTPQKQVQLLNDDELYDIIQMLSDKPLLAGESNIRLSLSGAQGKLPVTLIDDQIALVKGGSTSTHILKVPLSGHKDSLHNELFCLSLAELFGFNVPKHNLRWCLNTPYLLIERFDRNYDLDGNVIKLHQEDLCQARSILPLNKDESEGGLTYVDCLNLIDSHVKYPAVDKIAFLRLIIFNYLIGNSNSNSKDFSFLYTDNKVVLAPFYNLFSNAVYEKLSPKMSMSIDGKYYSNLVKLNHWYQLVADNSTAKRMIEKELYKMANLLPKLAEKLALKLNSEVFNSEVYSQIISIIDKRAKHIQRYSEPMMPVEENKASINVLEKPKEINETEILSHEKQDVKAKQPDPVKFVDKNEDEKFIIQSKNSLKEEGLDDQVRHKIKSEPTFDKLSNPTDPPIKQDTKPVISESEEHEVTFDIFEKAKDTQIKREERPVASENTKPKSTFDKLRKAKETPIGREERPVASKNAKPQSTFDKLRKPKDTSIERKERPVASENAKPQSTFDKLRKPKDTSIEREERPVASENAKPQSTFDKLRKPKDAPVKREEKPIVNENVKPQSTFEKLSKPKAHPIRQEKSPVINENFKPESTFDKLRKDKESEIKREEGLTSSEKVRPESTFDKLKKQKDQPSDQKDKLLNKKDIKYKSTFDKLNKIDYDK